MQYINKVSLVLVSSCSITGSGENCLELIELTRLLQSCDDLRCFKSVAELLFPVS